MPLGDRDLPISSVKKFEIDMGGERPLPPRLPRRPERDRARGAFEEEIRLGERPPAPGGEADAHRARDFVRSLDAEPEVERSAPAVVGAIEARGGGRFD